MTSWTCYLAAPIDQSQGDAPSSRLIADTRAGLKMMLEQAGAKVYDPYRPEVGSAIGHDFETRKRLWEDNRHALETADAVLAYLPDGVPSIGTPVEIERAQAMGKPVVVLGGDAVMNTPTWALESTVSIMDIDVVNLQVVIAGLLHRVRMNQAPPGQESIADSFNVPTARPKLAAIPPAVTSELHKKIHDWAEKSIARNPLAKLPLSYGLERTFLELVTQEIARATAKHPEKTLSNTLPDWYSVWLEEMLEVVQAWNDQNLEHLVEELIQAGAMTSRFWQSAVT